jgi:hypothetical protein
MLGHCVSHFERAAVVLGVRHCQTGPDHIAVPKQGAGISVEVDPLRGHDEVIPAEAEKPVGIMSVIAKIGRQWRMAI